MPPTSNFTCNITTTTATNNNHNNNNNNFFNKTNYWVNVEKIVNVLVLANQNLFPILLCCLSLQTFIRFLNLLNSIKKLIKHHVFSLPQVCWFCFLSFLNSLGPYFSSLTAFNSWLVCFYRQQTWNSSSVCAKPHHRQKCKPKKASELSKWNPDLGRSFKWR